MVTCSGNYTQLTRDTPRSFAVQTVVCDGLNGDLRITVTVPISGIHTYIYSYIIILEHEYTPISNFIVADTHATSSFTSTISNYKEGKIST